jgi:hypothetical protein
MIPFLQQDPVATISFQTWIPIVVALIALLGVLIVPIINTTLAYRNAKQAAIAAAEVARVLQETKSSTDRKLDEIYKLADGRLSAALEKIDRLEARAFEVEGTNPTGEPPPHTRLKD